jgi:hypothetical protein
LVCKYKYKERDIEITIVSHRLLMGF